MVSRSSFSWQSFGLPSASEELFIVLNLYSVKGLPPFPIRSCEKITGPLLSHLMMIMMIRKSGEKTIIPQMLAMQSKNLFRFSSIVLILVLGDVADISFVVDIVFSLILSVMALGRIYCLVQR